MICLPPTRRPSVLSLVVLFFILAAVPRADAQRVLFDASHGQTAGNADWIIDADTSDQVWLNYKCQHTDNHHSAQRLPTPPQETLTLDSPETVWDGGISAWAVDLAKDALDPGRDRDWQIEQYPWDAPEMTFGDPINPQDLGNYDVLILCEPNVLFTAAEAQAVREFVASGGGLFLCADHETSDRNCSGGGAERHDSPFILNRLMQTDVETRRDPPYFDPSHPGNDYGVFGIWFYENDNDDPDDRDNRAFDWFTEEVSDNVANDPTDPILHGPFGDGTPGIGLHGSTQIAISNHPDLGNPTVKGHIWRDDAQQGFNAQGVDVEVTFASAQFGAGRVVAVGDSSPADDDTGEGTLYPGWDKDPNGTANDVVFLNATEWIANPAPDTTPPGITAGPAAVAADCTAEITWITDEAADSTVAWGEDDALGQDSQQATAVTGHRVTLTGLSPETSYRYRVSSSDRQGNGPTVSPLNGFTTAALQPIGLPEAIQHTADATSITLTWQTAKPTTARAEARATDGTVVEAAGGEAVTDHTLVLAGLAPASEYSVEVWAEDGCGDTASSAPFPVTTAEAPAEVDVSGWKLVSGHPQFEFTFPAGSAIAAGEVVILGRNHDAAGFESEWGLLPEGVRYVDTGGGLLVNSTARAYTLLDAQGGVVDGPTVEIGKGRSLGRTGACSDAGIATAWEERSASAADPGRAVAPACGAGVVITEISDAGDFRNEFVELRFDAAGQH